MRDVSRKTTSLRTARAQAVVRVSPATSALISGGTLPKGDPIPIARVAGIQAAKQTSTLIPFCHPVAVEHADASFTVHRDRVEIVTTVTAVHKTGVEMEALTAAAAAALTIYDMTKMVDDDVEILSIRLLEKRGGKSDAARAVPNGIRVGVLVLSDTTAMGKRTDESGRHIAERLNEYGAEVTGPRVLPDESSEIEAALKAMADEDKLDIVFTTGGTGLGPRDRTPEATRAVIDREAPGIAETIRAYGQGRVQTAMFSRAVAGVRGQTLIINLPGSLRGVQESLDALLPGVLHALAMLAGKGH